MTSDASSKHELETKIKTYLDRQEGDRVVFRPVTRAESNSMAGSYSVGVIDKSVIAHR
jgi:hypothetical protein